MRGRWICVMVLCSILAFTACQKGNGGRDVSVQKTGGPIVKAVAEGGGVVETVEPGGENDLRSPTITFDNTEFDFGSVDEGEKVEHVFLFKNTGQGDLHIANVRSS